MDEIEKWQRNNNRFTSRNEIERELWEYYCSREPERCANGRSFAQGEEYRTIGPITPREVTPAVQGPPIWTFLNTLAVQWTPALHHYFLDTCDAIVSILECPVCRNEYRQIIAEDSPMRVKNRLQACQLVNRWHNKVNARIGKNEYPYERMILEYGAPLP